MTDPCPFCNIDNDRIIAETAHTVTIRDGVPVSPGHTLIIPRRHVASIFDTTEEELGQLAPPPDRTHAQTPAINSCCPYRVPAVPGVPGSSHPLAQGMHEAFQFGSVGRLHPLKTWTSTRTVTIDIHVVQQKHVEME